MAEATGHSWNVWFELLDAWGAVDRTHTEMARWLVEEHDVPSWWAQGVTVAYEQARGLRAPGQHADGWSANATKTISVPVERLFAAFQDPQLRGRWLPDGSLTPRTSTAPRSARYD